jgi:hypothetical protein
VIPRDAPLVIWEDDQFLPWGEDERAALADEPASAHLLGALPGRNPLPP